MDIPRITSLEQYQSLYSDSINQPETFWAAQAETFIKWHKPWQTVSNYNFEKGQIQWFEGATLNACENCVDRHLQDKGDKTAIIWEANEPGQSVKITYKELHEKVCRFANVLKSLNIEAGDRVCIYMPMIPQAVIAMLACARIGAVHSVVFGGFSPESLSKRIHDCQAKLVITADGLVRGEKTIAIKDNVDQAIDKITYNGKVLVIQHLKSEINWQQDRDHWYHELESTVDANAPIEAFDAEHPLFILYTSGSTGTPKGIMHTTGGYMLYASITHQYIFDHKDSDVYWCSADIGWVTGHTYLVYGPLANGSTIVMYEGVPAYPTPARLWEIIDEHQVTIFYTAPTLIRSLMALGDEHLKTTARNSLRILGTVGEPINHAAWEWYFNEVGHGQCPIVDTWWQTETGGILISPFPGVSNPKPGSAAHPFFGIKPVLLDMDSETPKPARKGYLTFEASWPGQSRSIYNNHDRFVETYYSQYPGYYFSGDAAYQDEDDYYWVTGRVDDVINVSGHRIGTSEIESILCEDHHVAEAAVIGASHEIKGECVYPFVRLKKGMEASDEIKTHLISLVKTNIGSFAAPETIHWVQDLPKTRSGKIMRRILRKIADKHTEDFGDLSTLSDPSVIEQIIESRPGG